MMPFYQTGGFDYPVAMLLATVLGIGFGFVLERAGFGRADVLVGQFYGTDMRVLKVMFTAIATTAVGIGLLSGLGAMELGKLVIPDTFVWPQLLGGLLLGVGFVVSGYCPGTAVVASASGNVDGLYTLGGVMLGSLVFGVVYPLVEALYTAGGMGRVTFPEVLGVPWAVVALGVVVLAVASFVLAGRLEAVFARRAGIDPPSDSVKVRNRTLAGLAGVGLATLLTMLLPPALVEPAPSRALAALSPVDLAQRMLNDPDALYLVDVRAPEECARGTLPGAMCLPADDRDGAFIGALPATRTLVLVDAAGAGAAPPSMGRFAGPAFKVEGGLAGFQAAIMEAPTPPAEATEDALSDYRLRAALHQRFTGSAAAAETPMPTVKPVTRAVKKGGGC